MKREDCKEGVRVCWKGDAFSDSDRGNIYCKGSSIWCKYSSNSVFVKWDSDGKVEHIPYKLLELENPQELTQEMTEEQAIMFLLSKGYTVRKSKE